MGILSLPTVTSQYAMDTLLGGGEPGQRWGAQDRYRRLDGESQVAAGIGSVGAVALVGKAGASWAKRGFWTDWRTAGPLGGLAADVLPGAQRLSPTAAKAVAVPVGLGALGLAGYNGSQRVWDQFQDDGSYRLPGIAGGALVGGGAAYLLGRGSLMKMTGIVGGAVAGGIIGKEHRFRAPATGPAPSEAKVHTGLGAWLIDLPRGAWNHATDVGMWSQGVNLSFGGKRQAYRNEYNKQEQAGGAIGDLGMAALAGGAAIGTAGFMLSNKLVKVAPEAYALAPGEFAKRAGTVPGVRRATLTSLPLWTLQQATVRYAGASKGTQAALAAAGAGVAGLLVRNWYQDSKETFGSEQAGIAGGVVAAGAGAASMAAFSKAPLMRTMPASNKLAASGLGAVVLLSALSAARLPAFSFVQDANDLHETKEKGHRRTELIAAGVGSLPGAVMGAKVGAKLGGGGLLGKALGTVAGAGIGGGVGFGVSPLFFDRAKVPA